jgi:hypothetical protein
LGWVTKDQIERAREIDVLDYVLRYEHDNVKRVGSAYRMRDHPSIEVKSGKWRWYSQGLYGKTALDYLTDVRGYSLVDAVCMLLNEPPQEKERRDKPKIRAPAPDAKPPPERPAFAIPRHNKNNNRVIAYLRSRGIDKELILDCIRRGILYESAYFHDCVFKGKDEHGKTRYAAVRSTSSGFKGDAEGSDKQCCFLLPPDDPDNRTAAIFEAPVDVLSHKTLCIQGFIPPFDGWRLSLGGTSILGLEHFLEHHPRITHCLVCTDNDEAGELLAAKIADVPGITTERSLPVCGKDWNDALQAMQKAGRTQNKARHNDGPGL